MKILEHIPLTFTETNNENIEDIVSVFVRAKVKPAASQDRLSKRQSDSSSDGKWTDVVMVDNNNNGANWEKCQEWSNNEESTSEDLSRKVESAACPPTKERADLANSGLKLDNEFTSRYHPDAENCYTQRTPTQ